MARLSKHGEEIGRVFFTTRTRAYMSDGTILENAGNGWKVCAKTSDPKQAFESQRAKQQSLLAARPCLAEYRKELRDIAGMSKAWKLHTAIQFLGDDVDGIWSECCDGYGDNVHASVDEISKLVRLYNNAFNERVDAIVM